MNSKLKFAICGAAICLVGCVAPGSQSVSERVGPEPITTPTAQSSVGTLTVYSAYEVNADFNSRDPYRPEYSDYKICTEDGTLLQRVHNDSGTALQDPAGVQLPAGKYRVIARANSCGWVTIPILIQPGRETVLHLEGGVQWPGDTQSTKTNAVRLQDSRIIGWKSGADL